MRRREFFRTAVVLSGSVAIAGCTDDSDSRNGGDDDGNGAGENDVGNNDTPEQAQPPGTRWYEDETEIGVLEGVEAELDRIGNLYIRGIAKNFGDTDYEYVQLSFDVYNENETKIGDGLANTSGLASGQRWQFEALAPGAEDTASYALTDITAY
ncbi:FxLYD domain-containing protein [Halorientalis pallida]|uniref:FxLYD domain-containing protein n=1 Tax=Halorientalis pallida TaxID=2479928 RepID=UPI003C6F1968